MTKSQDAKACVRAHMAALDAAGANEVAAVLAKRLAPEHAYRGVMPFYELSGPVALSDAVWAPLKAAMPVMQRRLDMFLAGPNALPDTQGIWVVAMGHFLGDFTAPWLGIPATQGTVFLPFVSLYRVEGDVIVETVEFLDILAVLTQAGQNPYANSQSGGHLMAPGPRTHDGVMDHPADATQSRATFELTNAMLADLAKSYTSPADHMARFWHSDMNWFGPCGIGASLGFSGYRRGHTGPFEAKLDMVDILDEELSVAEGNFSAVMWWPCLRMRNSGGYMGVDANDNLTEMRVVDLYRRDGDKLAENWIFIDMLHFLKLQDIDLLAKIGETE